MKILNTDQIRACDAFTIQEEGIASLDLMERAAARCGDWITKHYPGRPVLVICGMGNNGGDGLALTRLLLQHGAAAKAIILKHSDRFTPDAAHNLELLHQTDAEKVQILEEGCLLTDLPEDVLIADALFGTGLNRPLESWPAAFVRELNTLPNEKIAIDIPSGLPADSLPIPGAAVVQANHTLSFQLYKRSYLHTESEPFTGEIHLLDIELSPAFLEAEPSRYQIIDSGIIEKIYRRRLSSGHKGTYGKALLTGGSYGKIGAIALSTAAALRTGAGLVFVQAPECGYNILQSLCPEAMFLPAGDKIITDALTLEGAACGVGPGMGTSAVTATAFQHFLENCREPVVIDADALNLLAEKKGALHLLPPGSILSPHPKEFERLFGSFANSLERTEAARAKAMKYNIYVILKGHRTVVASPSGACWYNTTGNPGMATGGSGDVLTGILTALLAQGYTPEETSLMGVFLHGMAGDIAARNYSEEAMVAGDIVRHIGDCFKAINSWNGKNRQM